MSVRIINADVFDGLAQIEADSVDCVVTSPPYWGLRDYGVQGQIGLERTLGDHLEVMVRVFDSVRRVMKPEGTLWLNYGDCYATTPNGRSAAATKEAGNDDRTFRDKPFSTIGAIYSPNHETGDRRGKTGNLGHASGEVQNRGRVVAGGILKRKDLCMIPNRLAIALQEAGWWVRSEIIWGKPNAMPDSSGRYRPSTSHEKIFLLTKSADSYYDSESVRMPVAETTVGRLSQDLESQAGSSRANGGVRADRPMKAVGSSTGRLLRNYEPDLSPIIPPQVWNIACSGFEEAHFATFPPALAATCIMAGCPEGGLVLDPFGGAGTTGLVADRLRRDAVLIELNSDYAEMAKRRIERDAGMFSELA